ncbi:hypothetical protein [Rhodomicrobium sp.]|uniref:terminase small subunit-like protein n=1 Tax=Rhodomicrobium sp. TaxID=2720632 RepID=UPI0039E346CD
MDPITKAVLKRPEAMTPEVEQRILEGIASGRTLAEVCADPGMPSPSTVYRTLRVDPAFADTFALAERQFADEKFREISVIVAKVQAGKIDPTSARVAIDALRWQCARLAKKYNDRIEVTGEEGAPLLPPPPREISDIELARRAASLLLRTGKETGVPAALLGYDDGDDGEDERA